MLSTSQILALTGTLCILQTTYTLLRLATVYFGPSHVRRYLHSANSYALVTGATDGIGKAVARELYNKGFNLILHGRNEEKLQKVQAELKAQASASRDVRLWVANANDPDVDFEAAVAQWDDLEITLVIHNVGSAPPREPTIDGSPAKDLLTDIRRNALFPFLFTRALLPRLRRVPGPTQLVYCGSLSSSLPIPRIIPYGATKAFLRQLSASLGADELFRPARPSGVSTLYMDVGSVTTQAHGKAPSFATPTADVFARHFVHCIGCGRASVVPYWPHAIQRAVVEVLPESILMTTVFKAMDEELLIMKKLSS